MPSLTERFGSLWRAAPSALGGRLSERESPSATESSAPATGGRLPGGESPVANVKASRVGPLIAYDNLGQPVWSPRDYGAFAREGFMQNAIVYRSVRMIAEAAASIPLLLYAGSDEIETHPLLDLIRKPSADHTGPDFLDAWFGFLLVSGNAYVEAVAVDGQIRELHNLRPDRMKVLPGLDGWPEGYEYTAGGKSVRFLDEPAPGVRPVLHTRLFHPANDHYGMSPIEAAATAIDIHNTASGWNKALLDNSARPSGALVYAASNGQMTDEQFARLKSELETNYQGASHAGRPLLLEGGLDWKPLSLSPKDMDFIEAKNAAAREIALAVGVPPMLLGIPGDNTFANYAEAQRALWRNTVLPLVNRMCAAFSTWLSPAFAGRLDGGQSANANIRLRESPGANVRLLPDLDQVEALNPEREALWARLQNVTFLTDDEKRAAAGYAALGGRLPEGESPSAKYRNDRPRVPAGNSDGGQWTSDGGGGVPAAREQQREREVLLAQAGPLDGYPIDLREEETLGGHAILEHVGTSEEYLTRRVLAEALKAADRGDEFRGLAVGSFTSLLSATKLVNSTISQNAIAVENVVSGREPQAVLTARFEAATGYEVYLPRLHSEPYRRDTYGVKVIILPDARAEKRYRVLTAFPIE